MSRTNEEWEVVVQAKVAEVLADTSSTNYAPAITTADKNFALTIDHTLLRPDATPSQVDTLCDEAIKYGFKVFGRLSHELSSSHYYSCFLFIFPFDLQHISFVFHVFFFVSFFKTHEGCAQLTCGASDHTRVCGCWNDSHAV